jgi:hypothetical protein
MNETVKSWCDAAGIVFTRSRPYRKNDQAHVEQKNGAVVRRMVGYRRLEGLEAAQVQARLYQSMRLFVNFFQPSFKLAETRREGAHVRKRYHPPQTAHQRLVGDPRVSARVQARLEVLHAKLDPVRLLCEIRSAQEQLIAIADKTPVPGTLPTEARATELEAFLTGLRHAWKEGDSRPVARSKPTAPRGRRRPDPIKDVTATLKAWHEADPGATGRQLLERLQATYPGRHPDGLLRTVQRRLKIWRVEQARALVFGAPGTTQEVGDAGNLGASLQTSPGPLPIRPQREPVYARARGPHGQALRAARPALALERRRARRLGNEQAGTKKRLPNELRNNRSDPQDHSCASHQSFGNIPDEAMESAGELH